MDPLTIVWFRQDLRIEDHPPLLAACQRGAVLPVYISGADGEGRWDLGGASKWWLHHSLESLIKDLNSIGLTLVIRRGSALEVLKQLVAETKASAVYWSRRYEPACIERDTEVKSYLATKRIDAQSFNSTLMFEPWTIANKQGKPFQVFTPFWKNCLGSESGPDLPLPIPKRSSSVTPKAETLALHDLELLPRIHWDEGIKKTWKPGTTHAKSLLSLFLKEPILNYKEARDLPAIEGISRLSPYLHFGEISPRMIWHIVLKTYAGRREEVECYLRQLGWREFAHHLLYYFPHTPEMPLRKDFMAFPWKENTGHLHAWQKGLTGYPFVDAGMRQLWHTGWMHNRVRMVVGSFLVKDLLISWNEGAKWFWDTLVDADLANNTLGWQWVGGCGADAAPYFRIFNPITQGEKFDPEAVYIRKWIPELAGIPNKWIHRPWEAPELILRDAGVMLGKTYPKPIVDHAKARIAALEAFSLIRNQE
ncbi:MAG TPA: deoxyribodipyrimidine photo-lyase [Parachlamydiaceae bacterium]|nr:deoxyribodipyrimidine photo-lyase [Parachlamydiaceae bacterium]